MFSKKSLFYSNQDMTETHPFPFTLAKKKRTGQRPQSSANSMSELDKGSLLQSNSPDYRSMAGSTRLASPDAPLSGNLSGNEMKIFSQQLNSIDNNIWTKNLRYVDDFRPHSCISRNNSLHANSVKSIQVSKAQSPLLSRNKSVDLQQEHVRQLWRQGNLSSNQQQQPFGGHVKLRIPKKLKVNLQCYQEIRAQKKGSEVQLPENKEAHQQYLKRVFGAVKVNLQRQNEVLRAAEREEAHKRAVAENREHIPARGIYNQDYEDLKHSLTVKEKNIKRRNILTHNPAYVANKKKQEEQQNQQELQKKKRLLLAETKTLLAKDLNSLQELTTKLFTDFKYNLNMYNFYHEGQLVDPVSSVRAKELYYKRLITQPYFSKIFKNELASSQQLTASQILQQTAKNSEKSVLSRAAMNRASIRVTNLMLFNQVKPKGDNKGSGSILFSPNRFVDASGPKNSPPKVTFEQLSFEQKCDVKLLQEKLRIEEIRNNLLDIDQYQQLQGILDEEYNKLQKLDKTQLEEIWLFEMRNENVLRLAQLLIRSAALINTCDNNRQNAMHIAMKRGNTQMLKLLLTNGADKQAKDLLGRTPRDLAQKYDQKKCLKIFDIFTQFGYIADID